MSLRQLKTLEFSPKSKTSTRRPQQDLWRILASIWRSLVNGDSVVLKVHPSRNDTNPWQQIAWMHAIFLLIEEPLSNKDNFLAEGVSILEGDYCTAYYITCISI